MNSSDFAVAFVSGLVPALFWLWFWLREDKEKPEPWGMIFLAFAAGMIAVPIVLPLQQLAMELYHGDNLVFVWVIIEEVLKYAVALIVVLWHKAVDEPIDLIIYMIVIALGFSALENALFIFHPLTTDTLANTFITSNFRFLGATLLHVLSSGTVGAMLALAFYKPDGVKIIYGSIGLFMAIVLHALFNFFIIDASGETILGIFLFVWLGIIMLFLVFEKVKLLEARYGSPFISNIKRK